MACIAALTRRRYQQFDMMGKPAFDPRRQREPEVRINMRIRADQVRVIGPTGSMLGVMTTREALRVAQEHLLDLVEVNPKAEPPVCKVMDFGKFKYEEKKRAREAKRKQTFVDIKEIKLRPKTDEHDLDFKVKAARRFVESGNKVKFVVRFRGREIAHPQQAEQHLNWITQQIEDISNVEFRPAMEGRTMTMLVAPKPAVMQRVAAAKAAQEAARKRAEAEERGGSAQAGETTITPDDVAIVMRGAAEQERQEEFESIGGDDEDADRADESDVPD